MNNEEWNKVNHSYLQEFLDATKNDNTFITGVVKATIAQFLQDVKHEFNLIAEGNEGVLTKEQVIQTQIDKLRICIIDLQVILTAKESKQ